MKLDTGLIPVTVTGGLEATRVAHFRIDLLDRYEHLVGELEGVEPGGSLSWSSQSSVHGSGSIPVNDVGQNVDWLNARLKVTAVTQDDTNSDHETPLGVFLPALPESAWSDRHRSWDVDLSDKTSILDTDTITDSSGNAKTYSLTKGTNVIKTVKAIIADAGEESPAIEADNDATLSSDMTWEPDTTRLKIINDLLDAANYFSLWCDGQGQYQASKYRDPKDRTPIYDMDAPFYDGHTSLLAPEWSYSHDIYAIPNRYVALVAGDEDDEGLNAVATDEDPDSPFSYQSRGRWVTKTDSEAEATDQKALDAYAKRMLESAQQTDTKLDVEHVYLPKLLVNSVIGFSAGDLQGILTSVSNTEVTLDPTATVKTTLKKVVS